MLRIKDWDKHFENASSRKLKRLDWVAIPNKTDGEGYTALVDHPEGAAHLGAWYAIVEIASKQSPRGHLPRGIPHSLGGICQSLSRMSRLPGRIFQDAIPRLIGIGWIEQFQPFTEELGESANRLGESANGLAGNPAIVAAQGTTGNYREGNNIELPPYPPVAGPEWSQLAVAVRRSFPQTDDVFVMRLAQACCSMAAATGKDCTDQFAAEAVDHCRTAANGSQTSAGLFMRTVPQTVKTWLTNGKGPQPARKRTLSEIVREA